MTRNNKLSRRLILRGLGGACLGLPLLESFAPRTANAAPNTGLPYAIFFRQACGVGCEQNTLIGSEPERFWPQSFGALNSGNVQGRALEELDTYLDRLLVVKNVRMEDFDYGDGHARGALQGLTARGPTVEGAAGESEAAGESIDYRIGKELNGGNDSLFLYSGSDGGWLGGPCISYTASGQRHTALTPWGAYQLMTGNVSSDPQLQAQLAARKKSVNDLVRGQLTTLMSSSALSAKDKTRLKNHFDAVRDLEVELSCFVDKTTEQALESGVDYSDDGFEVMATTRLNMQVAALAIACGFTRSVAIQVGSGNDGSTRYPNLDENNGFQETGSLMNDNFHYISHRRQSHDDSGTPIPNSDLLHHKVDRNFARMFRHLLAELEKYDTGDGHNLLYHGLAVWLNDNGNGPGHSARDIPIVIGGSAGGKVKQGQYIEAAQDEVNHAKLLTTIAAAVGVKESGGGPLMSFGDPGLPQGHLNEILTAPLT
jgi:hypothetical protein